MTDSNRVTLKINDTTIHFNVPPEEQERLIDQMKAESKVSPMHNFLVRTVDKESKEALMPFLVNPSSTMEIGGEVIAAAVPKLKITVGE